MLRLLVPHREKHVFRSRIDSVLMAGLLCLPCLAQQVGDRMLQAAIESSKHDLMNAHGSLDFTYDLSNTDVGPKSRTEPDNYCSGLLFLKTLMFVHLNLGRNTPAPQCPIPFGLGNGSSLVRLLPIS